MGRRPPCALALLTVAMVAAGCHAGWTRHGNRDPLGPPDVAAYIRSLENPRRDAYQKPDEVIRTLAVPADALVADVGCGPGYFTRRLARAVPRGVVFAVDVEPRQLDRLAEHLHADGAVNVVPVLGRVDDPHLPPGWFDLVLVVDTYHHFEDRPVYLQTLARALKAGGRLVIIDYHKRAMPVGPPITHKMAREQVLDEVRASGFQLIDEPTFLPYQYFLIFGLGS